MTTQLSMFQPARGRPRSVQPANGLAEGRRRARKGMKRAAENSGDFKERIAALVEEVARRQHMLTMDDIRAAAAEQGIEPHHPNAYGHVLPSAARRGLVRRRADLPRIPSERPEAHGNPNLQWESLIFKGCVDQ